MADARITLSVAFTLTEIFHALGGRTDLYDSVDEFVAALDDRQVDETLRRTITVCAPF